MPASTAPAVLFVPALLVAVQHIEEWGRGKSVYTAVQKAGASRSLQLIQKNSASTKVNKAGRGKGVPVGAT